MTEFDRSYTSSNQFAVVSTALSCTTFKLFDIEERCDRQGSLKVIRNGTIELFDRSQCHTTSYSSSITIAIYSIFSKIKRDGGQKS